MIERHPDDAALFALATGRLATSLAIVVDAHLEHCEHCRRAVARYESVAGSLLDTLEPATLEVDAFDRTLARLDQPAPPVVPLRAGSRPTMPTGAEWPAALEHCDASPWRWLGPGMRWSRVQVPGDASTNLFLLRIGAGKSLPRHTHSGREFTQVLHGSFTDERARYAPGDFDATDDAVRHQPVVEASGECICLAGVDGRVVFEGMIARVFSAAVGL